PLPEGAGFDFSIHSTMALRARSATPKALPTTRSHKLDRSWGRPLKSERTGPFPEFERIGDNHRCSIRDLAPMVIRPYGFQEEAGRAALCLPEGEFVLFARRRVAIEMIDLVIPDKVF